MKNEIEKSDILAFQEKYIENEQNINIENKIKKLGIMRASKNTAKKEELKFNFNVEVPETKIYDQLDGHQCNIYSFLRVVKDIMRKNTNLDIDKLDLSSNYINFFDKLEKANSLYNDLISTKHLSLELINNKVNRYIGSFGTFHFCREIVNKYGLVPSENMNEINSQYNDALTIELLKDKIKTDAVILINLSKKEKINKKDELIFEVFQFLSKVYGNPPIKFKFNDEIITPLDFKDKYLKDNLKDFITITSFNKEAFFNSYSFIPNIYLYDDEKIIYLPLPKVKNAILKQLQDGISVWFSSEESTKINSNDSLLDDDLYDLAQTLNIKDIPKKQKLQLDIISYDHAMCITGALVENGNIKQFKVDNSFGEYGVFNGRMIMTNSFFENCVITTIINKKYLN